MTWQEYCNCLIPMRQKFGKNVFCDDKIKKGFEQWRSKPMSELLSLVNESIFSGVIFNIYTPTIEPKKEIPAKTINYSYHQTEGFLERWLALNGCKTIEDALKKEIEKNRK